MTHSYCGGRPYSRPWIETSSAPTPTPGGTVAAGRTAGRGLKPARAGRAGGQAEVAAGRTAGRGLKLHAPRRAYGGGRVAAGRTAGRGLKHFGTTSGASAAPWRPAEQPAVD